MGLVWCLARMCGFVFARLHGRHLSISVVILGCGKDCRYLVLLEGKGRALLVVFSYLVGFVPECPTAYHLGLGAWSLVEEGLPIGHNVVLEKGALNLRVVGPVGGYGVQHIGGPCLHPGQHSAAQGHRRVSSNLPSR